MPDSVLQSRRPTLAQWLVIALVGSAALLAAVLLLLVAPTTAAALREHGAATLQQSAAQMRELTERQIVAQSRVLVDLIRNNAASRGDALRDLPLESYGGDVAAMRDAVLREDAERSDRQCRNVDLLAAEVRRRAEGDIAAALAAIRTEEAERSRQFLAGLGRSHLGLVAATLTALVLVLGVGLHFLVVRPAMRLRRATRRVTFGALEVDLPSPPRGELGDLTNDFSFMVAELQRARERTRQLTENLEHEVAKKTEHLERTLRDLRASHSQLAQAERLAALGTLAGGVAHEFHNVIGGIRGCTKELLADEQDADRRETLAVIHRASERATGIVQQLQRFARAPVARQQQVDLAVVLTDALRLCEPAARRQGVQVATTLAPVAVTADGDALHQVFVNLLVNALQAMPSGGALRVELTADADTARATVADSGPGIPAAALPHVFEPFFTTKAGADDPAMRGSGLGLAVSFGIVTAHGGSITAASPPGGGACFTVALPRGAAPSVAPGG